MSKPESIKTQPWTDFEKQPYSFIKENFVHEKLFVLKGKAQGAKSTINLKQTLTKPKDKDEKELPLTVEDELKFWFGLPQNRTLYAVAKKDSLKLHYDNGIVEYGSQKWNFYGGINSNRALKDLQFKLGVSNVSKICSSNNRIRVSMKDKAQEYHWYHRTIVNKDKFLFSYVGVLDISHRVLQKNNLLFGYKHNEKQSFYFRAIVDKFKKAETDNLIKYNDWKTYFDMIIFNYVGVINDNTKVGLEATFNTQGDKRIKEIQGIVEQKIPDSKAVLSLKVNDQLNLGFSIKSPLYRFEDLVTVTAGSLLSGIKEGKLNCAYGFQVDLNL